MFGFSLYLCTVFNLKVEAKIRNFFEYRKTLTINNKQQTEMKTTKELQSLVNIRPAYSSQGQYVITITYRGRYYSCHSSNSNAYDYFKDDSDVKRQREALIEAWNECKRKNELGIKNH